MQRTDILVARFLVFGLGGMGALGLLVSGCAGAPPSRRAPPAGTYDGQPYTVRQSADGRIAGQVCGQDVSYTVERRDGGVHLIGFLGTDVPSQIEVREVGEGRVLSGALGSTAGSSAVDLTLTPDGLSGRVGFRSFRLAPAGDQLVGQVRMAGTDVPVTATVQGLQALRALPPAVQGAVLPNLLTCFVAEIGSYGRSPLVVGFGGPRGAQPRGSSSAPQR